MPRPERLRERLEALAAVEVGVIVSDSFGRAWRQGTTDVALGVAGLAPLLISAARRDARGRELQTTQIAVADEIAGAAELVLGKARGVPAAIVRGVDVRGHGSAASTSSCRATGISSADERLRRKQVVRGIPDGAALSSSFMLPGIPR